MRNRKIVILTIANNAEKTLRRSIDSVLSQKHDNLVYYVCDNGSKDDTAAIIEEYAGNDNRINPVYYDVNGWRALELISTIITEHDEGYFVLLDADDEYKPDFLEKMVSFVEENDLGIAVCGTDSIDAVTGELISRKALGYDLLLSEKDFLDKFLIYRRYVYDFWGKIYTLPTLKKAYADYQMSKYASTEIGRNFELFNYSAFKASGKAGIYGESLHKYYVYPGSQSSGFFPGRIEASVHVYEAAKEFLLSFGGIDITTQDYLYAIYLGQINEVFDRLCNADLPQRTKQNYIEQIYNYPLTKEMLAHDAGLQFINLTKRDRFLCVINEWIARVTP